MKHIIPYMLPEPELVWGMTGRMIDGEPEKDWVYIRFGQIEVDDSELGEGEVWQDVARQKWAAIMESCQ